MDKNNRWSAEDARCRLVEILGDAVEAVSVRDHGESIYVDLDHDHLQTVTFANLQRIAEAFDTKLINLTGESAHWYSEQTGGDPATIELVIRLKS